MSINRGMDKEDVVHIYNGMSLGYKKEWMDLESVIQSEVSQKEKKEHQILMHIFGI